jgi:hypothetical protein
MIVGHEQYVTSYFKAKLSLDEFRIDDIPQVSHEENAILSSRYS